MLDAQVALEGHEFRNRLGGIVTHSRKTRWGKDYVKNEPAFREIIKDMKVLACATNEDKYMLITGLKNEGFTIGVTGIAPSDTKSLLKADVGFSLNELGSEVAKHSSDIILKNDSLASFVSAIMWGRNLYFNVKRYAQYYTTFIIVLSFTVFFSVLIEAHIPFNIFQLFWIYIIADYYAIYTLTRYKPSTAILLESIVTNEKKIFTPSMWRNIFLNGIYQILILAIVQNKSDSWLNVSQDLVIKDWNTDDELKFTLMFQIMFYFQISTIILSRNIKSYEFSIIKGVMHNIFSLIFIITFQILMVTYGGQVFKFSNLSLSLHILTVIIGFSPLLFVSLMK